MKLQNGMRKIGCICFYFYFWDENRPQQLNVGSLWSDAGFKNFLVFFRKMMVFWDQFLGFWWFFGMKWGWIFFSSSSSLCVRHYWRRFIKNWKRWNCVELDFALFDRGDFLENDFWSNFCQFIKKMVKNHVFKS